MEGFSVKVPDTGYNVRAGSRILAERVALLPACACGEVLTPRGKCLNVGVCNHADRAASRGSLTRGRASSVRAFSASGRVD